MNRRGFLSAILAAGVAPYVVTTAGVLMPVRQLWRPRVPRWSAEIQVFHRFHSGFEVGDLIKISGVGVFGVDTQFKVEQVLHGGGLQKMQLINFEEL